MTLFDHVPVSIDTEYGPSIHLDPVAMDNSSLRLAGVQDIRAEAGSVAVVFNATALVDAVLVRLAEHFEDPLTVDAMQDLADRVSGSREIDSRLRDVREAIGLALRDTVTVTLHGTTAVLFAERVIDEAGPAALAAREANSLTRADFIAAHVA